MASTVKYDLTDEWQLISGDGSNLAVQFAGQGQCEIHIGDEEPGEDDVGLVIATDWIGLPTSFSASSLGDGVQVWARSPNTAKIVVVAY
jgi:hypothetical protein